MSKRFKSININQWNENDVCDWIKSLSIKSSIKKEISTAIIESGIDGEMLLSFKTEDWKDLADQKMIGLKISQQFKIYCKSNHYPTARIKSDIDGIQKKNNIFEKQLTSLAKLVMELKSQVNLLEQTKSVVPYIKNICVSDIQVSTFIVDWEAEFTNDQQLFMAKHHMNVNDIRMNVEVSPYIGDDMNDSNIINTDNPFNTENKDDSKSNAPINSGVIVKTVKYCVGKSNYEARFNDLEPDTKYEVQINAVKLNYGGSKVVQTGSKKFPSKILTAGECENIYINLIPNNLKKKQWTLLYRASEHNFAASVFHTKCNNKASTITIIENTLGYVYGGYTSKAWSSSNAYTTDDKQFLFRLRSPKANDRPKLYPTATNGSNAIYNKSSYGPTFGGGHSLYLSDQCNVNQNSYCNISSSYQQNASNYAEFCGAYNFIVTNYEVWQIS